MGALLAVNGALFALLAVAVGVIWFREDIARGLGRADVAELRGLLEGARADAIQYVRVAERLAGALESAHGYIARTVVDGKVPQPVTSGRLALQQLEALNANGSAGYYGEAPNTSASGATPWIPRGRVEVQEGTGVQDPARVEKWQTVSRAIEARAGVDGRMNRHLRRVADDLLSGGLTHEEVAKRILAGDAAE